MLEIVEIHAGIATIRNGKVENSYQELLDRFDENAVEQQFTKK